MHYVLFTLCVILYLLCIVYTWISQCHVYHMWLIHLNNLIINVLKLPYLLINVLVFSIDISFSTMYLLLCNHASVCNNWLIVQTYHLRKKLWKHPWFLTDLSCTTVILFVPENKLDVCFLSTKRKELKKSRCISTVFIWSIHLIHKWG